MKNKHSSLPFSEGHTCEGRSQLNGIFRNLFKQRREPLEEQEMVISSQSKQKVGIGYLCGGPGTFEIDLYLNLNDHPWSLTMQQQVSSELRKRFYQKAEGDSRMARNSFFYRADGTTGPQQKFMIAEAGDRKVPQHKLDEAAQEIFDQIVTPQSLSMVASNK